MLEMFLDVKFKELYISMHKKSGETKIYKKKVKGNVCKHFLIQTLENKKKLIHAYIFKSKENASQNLQKKKYFHMLM